MLRKAERIFFGLTQCNDTMPQLISSLEEEEEEEAVFLREEKCKFRRILVYNRN